MRRCAVLAIALSLYSPGVIAGELKVIQVLDANVLPAVKVEVVDDRDDELDWASTGTELIATGPTVRVRSNIAYTLNDVSAAEAGPTNVAVQVVRGDSLETPTPVGGRDYGSRIVQTIDFGFPLVVDGDAWSLSVVYTFLPARI